MYRLIAIFGALVWIAAAAATAAESEDRAVRHFLFIGEPSATAWQYLMENPQDREEEVAAGMTAVGGKVLSYYFGLADGRNYITVELPDDNEVIQAVYLMRLPTGLLKSYQVIELMPSADMARALRRSSEFIELEQSLGGGVE